MKNILILVVMIALVPRARGEQAGAEPPPLAHNCQAKLELSEEVVRLLTKAASHATRSKACIDGPGQHVVVDEVRVCPDSQDAKLIVVEATYQVTRWAEGDTRACGRLLRNPGSKSTDKPAEEPKARSEPDLCAGTPAVTRHRMRFRFLRRGKGFVIELPREVPGVSDSGYGMTPLDQTHNGGCYGTSGPFKPAVIVIR